MFLFFKKNRFFEIIENRNAHFEEKTIAKNGFSICEKKAGVSRFLAIGGDCGGCEDFSAFFGDF